MKLLLFSVVQTVTGPESWLTKRMACGNETGSLAKSALTMARGIAASIFLLSAAHSSAAAKDLVDTLIDNGAFCIFLGAVRSADLEDTLRGDGPYTVFAPSDVAFARMTTKEIEEGMGSGEPSELALFVNRHIVPSEMTAKQLAGKRVRVETVAGTFLLLDGTQGQFLIGRDNDVLSADIRADNGVIHVPRSVIPLIEPDS